MSPPNEAVAREDAQFRGVPTDDVLIDLKDLKMHFPVTEGVFIQSVIAHLSLIHI